MLIQSISSKESKENISITDYNLLLLQYSDDEIQMSKLTAANTHSKETRSMQQYFTKRKHKLSRFHLKIHQIASSQDDATHLATKAFNFIQQ